MQSETTSKSIMRRFILLTSFVLTVAVLAGCATESDSHALFVGMSRDRLKARFGEPLRIERTPLGGEDWYYSFASWQPEMSGTVSSDGSGSLSMGVSDQPATREFPVHLSADGYVTEPLPAGKIVKSN